MMDIINKEKILELAKKLTQEGRLDRAIIEYERLLQLDPEDLRIKIKIAELFVKRKQIQDAIRLYKEVASAYADGGFYLKAVTVFKSVLRLNPSLIDVNIALSELYEKMGLVQDALYQYQIVSSAYDQKNDQAGVLYIREKMISLDPNNVSLRVRLAETYQLQGMVDKAIDIYEGLADRIKKKGETGQLIELYSKILSHRPERTELVREICRMFFKRGEWKETLKRMEVAKSFVEEDPELLSMQADIYTKLNQIETAKGKYRDLAEILLEKNDIEGALRAYEDVLSLGPEDEAEVLEAVEEVRKGAFKDVKAHVEERNKKISDEEEKIEAEVKFKEEATLKTEEMAKKLGVTPDEISITSTDAVKLGKDASTSYDLGAMYKQMGLKDEARNEFLKAHKAYQRLLVNGALDDSSRAIFEELDIMFTDRTKEEPKVRPEPKPKPEVKIRAKAAQGSEEKPPSKKKISFI
ncbi:MAG: hypothetical protein COV46_00695 [Deltaproteobacteria bacterium CG11_big_fil_rev_8_21_14_0_20_49_13]|nr:MAG: hypothetical protein COV46_00695 [Deltaproteobacteria bacterium CG11_big_fil_rev_8_21_14_0_20_49_13]